MKKKMIGVLLSVVLVAILAPILLAGCSSASVNKELSKPSEIEAEIDAVEEVEEEETVVVPPLFDTTRFTEINTFHELSYYVPAGWRTESNDSGSSIWYYPYSHNTDGFLQIFAGNMESQSFSSSSFVSAATKNGTLESSEDCEIAKMSGFKFRYKQEINESFYDIMAYAVPTSKYVYVISFSRPGELKEVDLNFIETFSSRTAIRGKSYYVAEEETKAAAEKEKKRLANLYSKTDFFTIPEYANQYDAWIKSGEYEEIYNLIEQYIDEENPEKNDTAYLIEGVMEPVMAEWGNINRVYDKVEDNAKFYYKGVESVSSSIHIIPYAMSYSGGVDVDLGFRASDWIFFDEITITTDSDNIRIAINPLSRVDDVISGGTIQEKFTTNSLDADELISIVNGQNSIIRFESDNGKKYDYDISAKEKEALRVMSKMYYLRKDLSDIHYAYKNGKEYDLKNHTTK